MSSHPFDRFALLLARGVSRRDVLRGLAALAAGTGIYALLPGAATARPAAPQDASEPQPPGFWPPDFPLDPPGEVIDDYIDCIAAGHTPEECDKGLPWCEIKEYLLNKSFPNITGILETLGPFGEDCGTTDCLQCCYVPSSNGCHSSYIGEDVINCNPRIYGAGTRGVGLTLLLAEPPPEGTCLFTPQVCTHVGMCLQGGAAAAGQGVAVLPHADPANYLTDPRAIKQRARVFATYALTQARHYLDEYATDTPDAPPLQSLTDALLGRGWATWRQDLAALTFDLNDPLFRVVDGAGNLIESASRANVGRLFGLLRLLTGLPNLAARLEHVESRVWSAADKASYLASTPDPDAALAESLDPHIVAILKRVPMLQDYQLLAAPRAGEAPAAGHYGGMALGQPPELRLSATPAGPAVTLTASLNDPTGAAGLARPLAVDWGDGRVDRYEIAAGQAALTATHEYALAGRYAIYAVAANNSGLRGAACAVVEVSGAGRAATSPAQIFSPTLLRVGLTGLAILNLPYTKDLRLALRFADAGGRRFRAGRSRIASGPTNITVPVELGDAYAHNPSRLEIAKFSVEPRHGLTAPVGGRIPSLKLSTLLLGVFSTAQMRVVDAALAARADLLAVYVEGASAPLPATAITVNGDGSITVPLLYRAGSTGPWQRVERIEVAIAPELFAGFVLDAAPTPLPAGTNAAWAERRPGSFTRLVDAPGPTPTSTPPTSPTPGEAPAQHKVFVPLVHD